METPTLSTKRLLFDAGLANSISWADLSRTYFGKSSSWLYHKLDGIDGNGKPNTFTDEEMSKFKEALTDLAKRLSDFAMKM